MESKLLKKKIEELKEVEKTNPQKAFVLAKEFRNEGRKNNDTQQMSYGEYYMGEAQFFLGRSAKLMQYATKSMMYFKKINDSIMISRCYNLMGIAYSSTEDYQLSLDSYMNALNIALNHQKINNKNALMNNIGVVYLQMGDVSSALKYFRQAYQKLRKKKRTNSKDLLFNVIINYADTLCHAEEYDLALHYLEETKQDKNCTMGYMDKLLIQVLHTKIFYGKKELERANQSFDEMMEMLKDGYDSFDVHSDYGRIGEVLITLEEYRRLEQIIQYLKDCASGNHVTADWIRAYRLEVKYFNKIGDTERELDALRKYRKMLEQREVERAKSQLEVLRNQMILRKTIEKYKKESEEMEEMRLLSERDALTGLLNRHSLNQLMDKYFKVAQKENKKFGCIFLDVDCFKEYNDTYGHVSGDACLQKVASVCKNLESENCFFSRYGGDEFFGVITGETDEGLKNRASEIMGQLLDMSIEHKNSKVMNRVTVSIGLVNMELTEEDNIIDFVNFSDRALYHAKERGRNSACFYNLIEKKEKKERFDCFEKKP
ncbi:MAG: tetratricopeptide repeat-containing diguanylate cyclase [Lachnospiraceae bacterium]